MPSSPFHPALANWFAKTFPEPTECQLRAWPAIRDGRHTLIAAPTGSGKTLAAFLSAIDELIKTGLDDGLEEQTSVVYVSPLKALSNDIHKNLDEPLQGVREELRTLGLASPEIRAAVRTGDTPQSERAAMRRSPPHILVTTPESLYILLTSDSGRAMLKTTRTVIVDEIHAIVGSKRGSHLALSLERLQALVDDKLIRIGLSATQKPIEEVARYLTGDDKECAIVDTGHGRQRDLAIELPDSPLEAVMSNEVFQEVYDRLAGLIETHRTTLVFVNTRRMAERVARHLSERIGEDYITSHHGSLARKQRLNAEQRLKAGELRALVATASLELGIDIGDVDLVCQLGSTRAIATFLQRAGRASHSVTGIPKARLFPFTRDELVECAALLDAIGRGELDRLKIPPKPLDVLAQQLVAMVGCEEWDEDGLFACVRRAYPYRDLTREEYDAVVAMLSQGISARRGRQGAYLHRDAINHRLRPRRGARLTAITCGGAIPDNAIYDVRQEPGDLFVGTLDEDFAIESLAGDIFQLGNTSWRILRVESGTVRVEDAQGQPPNIPFWFGEAPARTDELSFAVSRLRAEVEQRIGNDDEVQRWLIDTIHIAEPAAAQIAQYLAAGRNALGAMPTQQTLVMERFFDESGGMQLVIHSPFGNRVNRAWGLALRKRFCRKFNFELQAAATEDALILSLGETHSFPLEDVRNYLNTKSIREVLIQAMLDAPMFSVRWRWNATCSLVIPRFRGGRKVPPRLQRMNADDLMAVVFPDQLACAENVQGQREIPDHPLVNQTVNDCLYDAMDIEGLVRLLSDLETGKKELIARDLTEPSPLAQEILTANPYAFLDDAPLEERRTQAVIARRWMDPKTANDIGKLDPAAIENVMLEAWPDAQSADEMHDALMTAGFLTDEEIEKGPADINEALNDGNAVYWRDLITELVTAGRVSRLTLKSTPLNLWIAVERLPEFRVVFPYSSEDPKQRIPHEFTSRDWTSDDALLAILRDRLQCLGPVTATELAKPLALAASQVHSILSRLESEGFVLRGQFRDSGEKEWCERRLLARIHRYTVKRLRREIEPVSSTDFIRFLLDWQHVTSSTQQRGQSALAAVLKQLEGFTAPTAAWEEELLPTRISDYRPEWLDTLCLSGRITWTRLSSGKRGARGGPVRTTPIALISRKELASWTNAPRDINERPDLSSTAQKVQTYLTQHGASFFDDIVQDSGALKTQVEDALGELVAAGLVTSDSFSGLRALLIPSARRRNRVGRRRRGTVVNAIEESGRWTAIAAPAPKREDTEGSGCEQCAWTLLQRYGVVFRRLIEREDIPYPWRDLLLVYRRLEARGEIRGGRFIVGFSGEHFALPEAVGSLRALRRKKPDSKLISISATDPLNLVGIITPGPRIPALLSNRILYRDGIPVAIQFGKEVRIVGPLDSNTEWELRNAILSSPRSLIPRFRSALKLELT